MILLREFKRSNPEAKCNSVDNIGCKRWSSGLFLNSLPDDKILEWSKLKEVAEDIQKCIENEK